VFDHEFQWMAAKGYVVLYPNPRGSTSYGQEFGNVIQYRYPGDDYQDLMLGVDDAIKRGYIDEKKLAVTGGSGGGLLTNWVVTHTDRFAAGVAQRDIADWESWWYTADFTLFQPTWFKAPPFQDREDFKARSPITYINNVKTPMMFVLGETDTRTPMTAGGEAMFRALKFRRIPTVMVKFPNETHELSRAGQPWHRIERLQHIVGWFDKWLMGAAKPEYDVAPEVSVKPDAARRGKRSRPAKASGHEDAGRTVCCAVPSRWLALRDQKRWLSLALSRGSRDERFASQTYPCCSNALCRRSARLLVRSQRGGYNSFSIEQPGPKASYRWHSGAR